MLGEIALYSFIVLLLTGTYLTVFFKPSMVEIIYNGSYVPLKGVQMTEAYASTLDISFDVRGGLLMRRARRTRCRASRRTPRSSGRPSAARRTRCR